MLRNSLNETVKCEQTAGGECPASRPLSIHDALRRLAEEGTHGVCATGRYRAPYFAWGSGPPLLFVPGLAASGHIFALTIARLASQFRCISYDLPTGQGDGARLSRYKHADLVADLFALLDHLGIQQAYLYGSSFGGTIALKAMHTQPHRFPRAVLQGSFARRPLARAEIGLARMARYWPGRMKLVPFRAKALRHSHYGPFSGCEAGLWDFFLEYTGSVYIATLARQALVLHATDLRPILPAIGQPVLMICGDCDPLVRPVHEEALVRGLPNVHRIELQSCGHFPFLTHPDVLAELVRQFLTPPDGASKCEHPDQSRKSE